MGMKELRSTKQKRDEDGNDLKEKQLLAYIGRIHIRDGKPSWTGNLSDMNTVKDEFPVANLPVYVPPKPTGK